MPLSYAQRIRAVEGVRAISWANWFGGVYITGVVGGLVVGSVVGGVVARIWGVTGPFWFAFVGSVLILTAMWRQLGHIAHDDR